MEDTCDALLRAGRFIEAAQACRDRIDGDHAGLRRDWLGAMAEALCHGELFDEALSSLESAQADDGDDVLRYRKARVLAHAGRAGPALELLQAIAPASALSRQAGWLSARLRLAQAAPAEMPGLQAACREWCASNLDPWPADARSPLRDACFAAQPTPAREAFWREALSGREGLKVGLVWSEDARHPDAHHRSMAWADLAQLQRVPGITFVALQPGAPAAEAAGAGPLWLVPPREEADDAAETAAVLRQLDLFIGVDCAITDLAVRLGCPTWRLLGERPHWRWLREDAPCAANERLFRRAAGTQWPALVDQVARALHEHAAAPDKVARLSDQQCVLLLAARSLEQGEAAAARELITQLVQSYPRLSAQTVNQVWRWTCQTVDPGLLQCLDAQRHKLAPEGVWQLEHALAQHAAAEGRRAEALSRWTALLDAAPQAPCEIHCHAARAIQKAGGCPGQRHAAALANHPDAPELHLLAGQSALQAGDRDRAITHLQRAVHGAPRRVYAHKRLAYALIGADRRDEARLHLQLALRLRPADAWAWSCLAHVQLLQGAHASAELCARRHAQLEETGQGHAFLADVLYNQQAYPKALVAIEDGLRRLPDDLELRHAKALVLGHLGRTQEAIEAYRGVLALDAGHRNALFQLARLEPAQPQWLVRFRAATPQVAGCGR